MKSQRLLRAALCAALVAAAPAWAESPPGDFSRLAAQYAGWAGGRSNADAIVNGLRGGTSITLVTAAADRSVSLAGFTPGRTMGYAGIRAALASAQQSLSRLGIARPTAEQIQSALIGGEIAMPNGATRQVAGALGAAAPLG